MTAIDYTRGCDGICKSWSNDLMQALDSLGLGAASHHIGIETEQRPASRHHFPRCKLSPDKNTVEFVKQRYLSGYGMVRYCGTQFQIQQTDKGRIYSDFLNEEGYKVLRKL